MYELNNTVYITTQNTHLRLSNENLVVEPPDQPMRHVPLHHLTAIVLLGNIQVTTPLIAYCAQHGIDIVWCDSYGRYRARLEGQQSGSVWLRKAQHDALNDPDRALAFARRLVAGKIANQMRVFQRHMRDYADAASACSPPSPRWKPTTPKRTKRPRWTPCAASKAARPASTSDTSTC